MAETPHHGDSSSDAASPQPPLALRQLALQGAAAFGVLSLAWPYFGLRGTALPWPHTAFAIGAVAFVLAFLTRQPLWWKIIHACFAPLAWALSLLHIPPGWFLAAFVVSLLFYRGAVSGQIPLYLSNTHTVGALERILAQHQGARFVDLGAGIGSVIVPLARALPALSLTGIENAPASWLIGWVRTRGAPNARWQMGSLWSAPLGDYDIVYAFLSPAPMPALWQKASHEMKPGSLLISNSFTVPEVEATEVIELADARQTRLYCYLIPPKKEDRGE